MSFDPEKWKKWEVQEPKVVECPICNVKGTIPNTHIIVRNHPLGKYIPICHKCLGINQTTLY